MILTNESSTLNGAAPCRFLQPVAEWDNL